MKQIFLAKTNKVILTTLGISVAIFMSFPVMGQITPNPFIEQSLGKELQDYPEIEKLDLINTLSQNVLKDLSQRIGVEISNQYLIEFKRRNWTNNCMGLELENKKCLEVVTPGWLITITYDKQRYIYHTDERAFNVKLQESTPIINN